MSNAENQDENLAAMDRLAALTSEQLGLLFPIEIVSYDAEWPSMFRGEEELIKKTLTATTARRIEHFGSTAVPGLAAKPTIDILVEIPMLTSELKDAIIKKMKTINYQFIWRTDDATPYMMFVKGYTPEGIKEPSFHVHMAEYGHSLWDRLYFRDYLRENADAHKVYTELKMELAKKYRNDREAYTKGKTEYINGITSTAKKSKEK